MCSYFWSASIVGVGVTVPPRFVGKRGGQEAEGPTANLVGDGTSRRNGTAVKRTITALIALVLVALPAQAETLQACVDSDDVSIPFTLTVDGQDATGRYALPAAAPTGFVLFSHGYGHMSKSWDVHLRNAARDLNVIAVAMDYRGTQVVDPDAEYPSTRGWRVAEGAADGIAASQHFDAACPAMGAFVNFGVSMGGNTSGLIAAEAVKRADGVTPMFDYWVDVEGATNVSETYHEASAVAPVNAFAANAKADIEQEMGGTFAERREVYLERSVVTRAGDIAASGLKGVVLVHGLDDGLVPYNQSREMAAALYDAGVSYDFVTISRRDAESEKDTTITGTVIGPVKGDYVSPLAGHASERSTTNIVMKQALLRLSMLFSGDGPEEDCWGEYHVDGGGELGDAQKHCEF